MTVDWLCGSITSSIIQSIEQLRCLVLLVLTRADDPMCSQVKAIPNEGKKTYSVTYVPQVMGPHKVQFIILSVGPCSQSRDAQRGGERGQPFALPLIKCMSAHVPESKPYLNVSSPGCLASEYGGGY